MGDHGPQRRLPALDFYGGEIDGDPGSLSMAASVAFLSYGP